MRALSILILAALLSAPALAQTLVVYPFGGGESGLGALLADRVASAFEAQVDDAFGPAVAPGLVPPVPFDGGYLNPTAFLGEEGVASLHGAEVARSALGADVLLSGRMGEGEGLVLEAFAVRADGRTRARTFRGASDAPGELARRVALWLAPLVAAGPPSRSEPIDLRAGDDALGRALLLVGGGFIEEAATLLERAAEADDLSARAARLQENVRAVRAGEPAPDPALGAVLSLSRVDEDASAAREAFRRFRDASALPAAHAWLLALAKNEGDLEAARGFAEDAAAAYPYGRLARAALALDEQEAEARERLADLVEARDAASLLIASAWAERREAPDLERRALETLGRVTPTFVYPFERLSFLAFDRGDGLAAAEALAVAVNLEPESDLYWTNLGWAWYLLGFWERSERASERALELAPSQAIAGYNLGLVRARQGRLDEAMGPYEDALAVDPDVDDEAVLDVQNAVDELPEEPALRYALGRLLEAEGRRGEAADAYRAFLELGGAGEPFDSRAADRAEVLSAPPPPLDIAGQLDVRLGRDGPQLAPWHPGDPIVPSFEVVTPGDALPRRIDVAVTLEDAEGEVRARGESRVDVPPNAIGYVIDSVAVELPEDLEAAPYRLRARVSAPDQETAASREIRVEGEPEPLRRLVGRNVRLDALESGRALFRPEEVSRADAVVARLVQELHASANAADEALPGVEQGRFAGLSGGALFEQSDARDVRAFLAYLAAQDVSDTRLTFVDAYAQWALEGAPTE